jgi:hypothetical protein
MPPTHMVQQRVAIPRGLNVSRIADHTDNPQAQGPVPATPVPAHITAVPTPCACDFSRRCSPFLVSHSQSFSTNAKRLLFVLSFLLNHSIVMSRFIHSLTTFGPTGVEKVILGGPFSH